MTNEELCEVMKENRIREEIIICKQQEINELKKEIEELKSQNECEHNQFLDTRSKLEEQIEFNIQLSEEITELKELNDTKCKIVDKMHDMLNENIRWADQVKNDEMWQKLIKMRNEMDEL